MMGPFYYKGSNDIFVILVYIYAIIFIELKTSKAEDFCQRSLVRLQVVLVFLLYLSRT